MKRPRRPASELRLAIDMMPCDTKQAMLDAVNRSRIIVGAYTDRDGGVCPMLAAHRNGGRTTFASFARAWDRYTRAGNGAREATEREVRTLTAMLEASIAVDEVRGGTVLGEAIADHRRAQARRARREEHAAIEPGWSWLRPFKRLDEYERALEDLRRVRPAAEGEDRGEREPELV